MSNINSENILEVIQNVLNVNPDVTGLHIYETSTSTSVDWNTNTILDNSNEYVQVRGNIVNIAVERPNKIIDFLHDNYREEPEQGTFKMIVNKGDRLYIPM